MVIKMKIKTNKKAQMKIQQMAFMIIAVVMFFALVAIFMISFKLSSLRNEANLLNERNAMLLVTKLAESPEFSCGEAFGGKRTNCVDFDKALVLKSNIDAYDNFWGVDNIEVRQINEQNTNIQCTSSNYPDCDYLRIISEEVVGSSYSTFVSLCRKESYNGQIYDKCSLARFIVSYKQNE